MADLTRPSKRTHVSKVLKQYPTGTSTVSAERRAALDIAVSESRKAK